MTTGLMLTDVSLRFGELTILSRFNLRMRRGESLLVTGANGSGKSALLQVCAGLVPATTGTVTLNGYEPDMARPSTLFRQGVRRGFVFENGGLLANQTALNNVMLPLRYHADLLGLNEDEIEQKARVNLRNANSLKAKLTLVMQAVESAPVTGTDQATGSEIPKTGGWPAATAATEERPVRRGAVWPELKLSGVVDAG